MSNDSPDSSLENVQETRLADVFFKYAFDRLAREHGYFKADLRNDGKWHFVASVDGVSDYVLREFDGLEGETDDGSRRLTRKLERGFIGELRRGKLTAWGRESSPTASWIEIPASAWFVLWPEKLHKGIVAGEGARLFDVRVASSAPVSARRVTGAPGRPTSKHLVLKEFNRRADAEEVKDALRREAEFLCDWLKRTHRNAPPMTVKTIENVIRSQFNAYQRRHATAEKG